jgi:CHASE3 domain sensor protein
LNIELPHICNTLAAMNATHGRNGTPVNKTVSQLKKSFILINGAIAFFFLLYILQAYLLYERSSKSDLLLIHTNDVLNNIRSADANVAKIDASLNSYLLY